MTERRSCVHHCVNIMFTLHFIIFETTTPVQPPDEITDVLNLTSLDFQQLSSSSRVPNKSKGSAHRLFIQFFSISVFHQHQEIHDHAKRKLTVHQRRSGTSAAVDNSRFYHQLRLHLWVHRFLERQWMYLRQFTISSPITTSSPGELVFKCGSVWTNSRSHLENTESAIWWPTASCFQTYWISIGRKPRYDHKGRFCSWIKWWGLFPWTCQSISVDAQSVPAEIKRESARPTPPIHRRIFWIWHSHCKLLWYVIASVWSFWHIQMAYEWQKNRDRAFVWE